VWPTLLCKQKVKTCATSPNDDKFAHVWGVWAEILVYEPAKVSHFALADVDFLPVYYFENTIDVVFPRGKSYLSTGELSHPSQKTGVV
jgi:hypothetical protein